MLSEGSNSKGLNDNESDGSEKVKGSAVLMPSSEEDDSENANVDVDEEFSELKGVEGISDFEEVALDRSFDPDEERELNGVAGGASNDLGEA